MILKEQSNIIMGKLNEIALDFYISTENELYNVQFYVTDNFQEYNGVTKLDDKEYIPAILTRMDPFVPKSSNGVVVDYLELRFYSKFKYRQVLEEITQEYNNRYHSIPALNGTELYTQYVGKFIYENEERGQDGSNLRYFYGVLRMEWDTILDGVSYDQTSLKVDNVEYPAKIQTYRNDKATIANKEYNAVGNTNANLVSESLIITVPLNAVTAVSPLWADIHTRSYNKTYTIIDNYGAGGTLTKTWELKSGIVNKEENKIVSFTAIFDIPLPRATITITHRTNLGVETSGTVIVTNFTESSSNALDARSVSQVVKGREVRQVNGYSLSFLYETGSVIGKILAERSHKKVNGDRFDLTYTFEDLTFQLTDLVIEKGSHSFNENPGVIFTITFAEGV